MLCLLMGVLSYLYELFFIIMPLSPNVHFEYSLKGLSGE